MPTFDKRARYPGNQSRIAIPTLSGGVGRQAPTKRAINEAQNLDNILVTLERSAEKRAGTNFIQRYSDAAFTTLDTASPNSSQLDLHDKSATADYKFFWFQISEDQRYLIAINYKSEASAGSPTSDELAQYMQIFRVTKNGFLECGLSGHNTADFFNYFTYKGSDSTKKADDSLSSITVGPQMLVNNNSVFAGYTSKERTFSGSDKLDGVSKTSGTAWCTIGLDGEFNTLAANDYEEDIKGRKLTYFTTTPVDTEGQASVYVEGKFYVKNDQVFASIAADGTVNLAPHLSEDIDFTGTVSFSTATPASGDHIFTVTQDDLPNILKQNKVHSFVVDHTVNSDTDGEEEVYLVFESGETTIRDNFRTGLTRLSVGGKSLSLADSDAVASTYSGLPAIKWTAGGTSNDDVHAVADAVKSAYSSSVPFSTAFDIKGIFNPTGKSLPTSLIPFVDSNSILQNTYAEGGSNVLVFTCVRDGTANESTPASAETATSADAYFTLRSEDDGGPIAKYIPVEDWQYPDAQRRYLGNQFSDFSQFNFPPKSNEATAESDGAGTDAKVAKLNKPAVNMHGKIPATLLALYSDIDSSGDGKIYYVQNSFAGEVPGYYIVKDVENTPYTRLVRTPEEYSVLDEKRFPKIIKIDSFVGGIEQFVVQNMDLEERRSGNLKTNTGPEAFKDGVQVPIKSMAFFRDRLFLSAGDTVFSSRTGDFSDFWVSNPGVIADTDPIDVRLSTNKYAEVESMTPFASSMFVNTGSDIQFTLKGSENNITPFTAEVSPTAFYSTSPLVNPVLLGSQIYFFAPNRAYVYFNDSTVTVNQAIEVSLNCPNYLPATFGDIAVVPGYDSLCMIDKDNRKFLYIYTNRYRGADVVQNAFYRYVYDQDVMSVQSYDNDIYLVLRQQPTGSTTFNYFLEYQKFYEEDNSIPRLDHQVVVPEGLASQFGSITYDASTGHTTIVVKKYGNPAPDYLYIAATANQLEERDGEAILIGSNRDSDVVVSMSHADGTLTLVLNGNYTTSSNYRTFIFGTTYNSTIELSPQYVRDEGNNVVEGVLSLRTLHLQHHNTGTYRIEKATRGRRKTALTVTPKELSEYPSSASDVRDEDDSPLPLYEKNGESFTKIMGYAAETDIFIVSDYPNPMNIAQIELKGKFTTKTSGFVR